MNILVINGPNLNMLGSRNKKIYGNITLSDINRMLISQAKKLKCKLKFFQSNHEGKIIDFIQREYCNSDGILINPGALTHYSYSLRDSLEDCRLPVIEVHLSDLSKREKFRKIDVLEGIIKGKISGQKDNSYILGLNKLVAYLHKIQ
jgi:3-dehydroquinate dehydratase II